MHPLIRILLLTAAGGILFGFHLALLAKGSTAAWVFFNSVIGILMIYFASLQAGELIKPPGNNSDDE